MKVIPIKPQESAERHVQFSEFIDVRVFEPNKPVGPTMIIPTPDAQRLERALRSAPANRPAAPAPVRQEARQEPPAQSKWVKLYKNICEKAALICGAFILPSFVCLILGPIGVIAPVAFTLGAILFTLARGKPTVEIRTEQNRRAEDGRRHDCT